VKTQKQLDNEMPARLLSAACAIIAAIHFYNSSGKADLVLLGFVALCALPWMGSVFDSISSNSLKWRNQQGEAPAPAEPIQQTKKIADLRKTDFLRFDLRRFDTRRALMAPLIPTPRASPLPATPHATTTAEQPSAMPIYLFAPIPFPMLTNQEKKVLATLWKYQKIHFPRNPEQRWTFTVGSNSPHYTQFSYGFLLLGAKGLATVAPSGQILLSNQGFNYCQSHDAEISRWPATYDDFSN
jgi:hypothetical protein